MVVSPLATDLNRDETVSLYDEMRIVRIVNKAIGFVTIQIRAHRAKHDALRSLPDRRKDAAIKATNEALQFLIHNS